MSPPCPGKKNTHLKTREVFLNDTEFHYKVSAIYFSYAKESPKKKKKEKKHKRGKDSNFTMKKIPL